MEPSNGALDSPIEKIVAKLSVAKPGIYNLLVRGSDEIGNIATEKGTILVVYNPEAGFAAGEGWINSPAGAYTPEPTLMGKATFKFTSKYQKDARTPVGQTDFTFPAAGMIFRSTSYDWLVVSEARAQYRGTGTINGAGSYSFTVTVVEDRTHGGAGFKFRIKIWDKATGRVIYDNNLGYPDYTTPTTPISAGSIDINIKCDSAKSNKEEPSK
jgi:hypothetical protein